VYFNKHIFKLEQQEYAKEKIQWQNIAYNVNIIQLLHSCMQYYYFFEILGLIDYLFSGQLASDSVAIEKACRNIAPSRRRV